jgi:hypothetical protein
MTQRITLSNGGWADIKAPAAVSERNRRPVEKALLAIGQSKAMQDLESATVGSIASTLDSASFDQFAELNDLLIMARLEAWSIEKPITLDNVLDLPGEDYKALQEATAQGITEMMPNFSASDDPNSPIKPSDA